MVSMSQAYSIRQPRKQGDSVTEIAREVEASRSTVRDHLVKDGPTRPKHPVCSQISVDTFGSRFSTQNAKTCRPPSKVPNLIDASVSTQKGRKGNDQHVHRQFYTPAAPRRVQHLGYRQDERRVARHRL